MKKQLSNYYIISLSLLIIYLFKCNFLYSYYQKQFIYNLALQNKTIINSNNQQNSSSPSTEINNNTNKNGEKKEYVYNYNNCTISRIPKVSGLLETAQYLRYTNSSLVRFGDGEFHLITGRGIFNKEKPNAELGRRLYEIFKDRDESVAVGLPNIFSYYPFYKKSTYYVWYERNKKYTDWMKENIDYNRQYFDAYITSPYVVTYGTSCELVDKVYENLRAIWEDKDIIWLRGDNGEEYENDVFDNARSKKIHYGLANYSWPKYGDYKELLLKEDSEKLYVLTLGHLSKLLVQDLTKKGRRALDLGHLPKDYEFFKKGIAPYKFYTI